MAQNSRIGWTDDTVNEHWGCVEKGPECGHCYAREMDKMRGPLFDGGRVHWGPESTRWIRTDKALGEIARIARNVPKTGRRRIFINSMSDTFEDNDSLIESRARLLDTIEATPQLTFQLLTKRPELVREMVPKHWLTNWPAHAWMGTTTGVQASADERIPFLLDIPAKVRFLSVEPMLEMVSLLRDTDATGLQWNYSTGGYDRVKPPGIHWVLVGGESGPKCRPFEERWATILLAQCRVAGIAFFMKQLGGHPHKRDNLLDFPEYLRVQEFPSHE